MKKFKVTIGILTIILFSITATACTGDKKAASNEQTTEVAHDHNDGHHEKEAAHDNSDGHHDAEKATTEKRDVTASTDKNTELSPIIDAYLAIKNGLVADSKEDAAKGAEQLLAAFAGFDMSKVSKEAHTEYMDIYENAKEQAEHIVKSPIDHQREHFEVLSTDINDLITLLGTDKTLYVTYCPMVKASWLSETKEIKNPFYGKKMLTCGSVKSQIN